MKIYYINWFPELLLYRYFRWVAHKFIKRKNVQKNLHRDFYKFLTNVPTLRRRTPPATICRSPPRHAARFSDRIPFPGSSCPHRYPQNRCDPPAGGFAARIYAFRRRGTAPFRRPAYTFPTTSPAAAPARWYLSFPGILRGMPPTPAVAGTRWGQRPSV